MIPTAIDSSKDSLQLLLLQVFRYLYPFQPLTPKVPPFQQCFRQIKNNTYILKKNLESPIHPPKFVSGFFGLVEVALMQRPAAGTATWIVLFGCYAQSLVQLKLQDVSHKITKN